MRRVIVESPYAGDVEANTAYARAALRDCLVRGEAPFASHLIYTQPGVLDDAEERRLGLDAGFAWGLTADATVVYLDRGISPGMREGVARAHAAGRPVEFRWIVERPAVEVTLDGEPVPSPLLEAVYEGDRLRLVFADHEIVALDYTRDVAGVIHLESAACRKKRASL